MTLDVERDNTLQTINELTNKTKLLTKRTSKDEKLLRMQKTIFDKHVHKLNCRIKQLEDGQKDKDKEIRMQAHKIKELVYAGTDVHRERIIKNDYALLQSLASAASPNRHLGSEISSADKVQKLE